MNDVGANQHPRRGGEEIRSLEGWHGFRNSGRMVGVWWVSRKSSHEHPEEAVNLLNCIKNASLRFWICIGSASKKRTCEARTPNSKEGFLTRGLDAQLIHSLEGIALTKPRPERGEQREPRGRPGSRGFERKKHVMNRRRSACWWAALPPTNTNGKFPRSNNRFIAAFPGLRRDSLSLAHLTQGFVIAIPSGCSCSAIFIAA